MTKIFYVIRQGWNAANQSSQGTKANPKNCFESNRYALVAIVEAETAGEAVTKAEETVTVYNGQFLFAESNRKAIVGLTQAIRNFEVAAK